MRLAPPQSTEAEWAAFRDTCERLGGFDEQMTFEFADGFLAALASGPNPPEPAAWLPVLCGDTFERVFADPQDHAQALEALTARLRTLQRMLDPEALFDEPEAIRLDPFLMSWTEEDRQALRDEGATEEAIAALPDPGADWAGGFITAVQGLPRPWPEAPDEESAEQMQLALDQIAALYLDPEALQAHIAEHYPHRKPEDPVTRDDLLAEACLSVQDLRMYCVDFAPVAATRRVEAAPGRNDPCPCGSGKKYKKCHGSGV